MAEYTAYLERNEWVAPGISSNYTSARCKTSIDSENDRASQEIEIDNRFVYAKSQIVQTLSFYDSDTTELHYPYLGSYGPTYRLPTFSSNYLPSAIPSSERSTLPQGVRLLNYKPEYIEESGWYEYLTGPKSGYFYRTTPPLKKWKYRWITRRKEIGIPSISFTKNSTEVKASHPWTGVIRVRYYYDRAARIKQKLKDNLTIEANYNIYLNPEGFDASSKEIDAFILPSEESSFWTSHGPEPYELWNELDCLICNPITNPQSNPIAEEASSYSGDFKDDINSARITHPTECSAPCRYVCADEILFKIADDHTWAMRTYMKAHSLSFAMGFMWNWNPHLVTSTYDAYGHMKLSFPDERIRQRIYDPDLWYTDEMIYWKEFSLNHDPGEDEVQRLAIAFFMFYRKSTMLNGKLDRIGAKTRKFIMGNPNSTIDPERWAYVVVVDMYGVKDSVPVRPCTSSSSDIPQPFFTCQPKCISKPCEWYQQIYGDQQDGGFYYLSPDIVMPCYVPWICALKEVRFYTETMGFRASIKPQWGMVRGFGDVEHKNPYVDLSEVNATIIWQMSDVIPFMIPGEYFYFIFIISFGEGSPCQFLYGPSGYFETHCLTSATILGCGYPDGSVGGRGVSYNKDNKWVFNERFRWLVYYKGKEFWIRPSDFAKYDIGDRVFIYKGGQMQLQNKTIACKGRGTFTDWNEVQGVQLTSKNVTYSLDSEMDLIIPEKLANRIG